MKRSSIESEKFHFAFYFYRNVERELRKAHSASTMGTDLGAKDFKDEIRESIDDARLLVEARRGIHHPEYSGPGGNAVQVTERSTQASKN